MLAEFKWKIPKEFRVTAHPPRVNNASPTDDAYILRPASRALFKNRFPARRAPSANTGQKIPRSSSSSPRSARRHRAARSGARGRAQVAVRGQAGQRRSAHGQPRAPGRPSAPQPLTARRSARRALPRGAALSPPPGRPAAGTKPRTPAPHRIAPTPAAPAPQRPPGAAGDNGHGPEWGRRPRHRGRRNARQKGRGSPAAAPANLSPAGRPAARGPPQLIPRPAPRHLPPAAGGGCGSPAPGSVPRRRRLCRRGQGAAATSRASPGRRPAPGTRAVPCPARPCPAAGTASRAAPQRAGRAGGAGPGRRAGRGGAGLGGETPPTTARPPAEGGVGRRGRACPRGGPGRGAGGPERALVRCQVPSTAFPACFLGSFNCSLYFLPFYRLHSASPFLILSLFPHHIAGLKMDLSSLNCFL